MDVDKQPTDAATADQQLDVGPSTSWAQAGQAERIRDKFDFISVPRTPSMVKLEPEMVTVVRNLDQQVAEARDVLTQFESMYQNQLRICARALGLDPDLQLFDRASASFIAKDTVGEFRPRS